MKKINKFALAAIAVISVAMIISTGIVAAKQAPVKRVSSPLPEVRAKQALGQSQTIEVITLEPANEMSKSGSLQMRPQVIINVDNPCTIDCPLCSICLRGCIPPQQ